MVRVRRTGASNAKTYISLYQLPSGPATASTTAKTTPTTAPATSRPTTITTSCPPGFTYWGRPQGRRRGLFSCKPGCVPETHGQYCSRCNCETTTTTSRTSTAAPTTAKTSKTGKCNAYCHNDKNICVQTAYCSQLHQQRLPLLQRESVR